MIGKTQVLEGVKEDTLAAYEKLCKTEQPNKRGNWSEPALRVLRERYLKRSGKEILETPEQMCWRVATEIAKGELASGKSAREMHRAALGFYDLVVDGVFVPNSPTLMNAGKQNGLQYSACYVLPVGDSMLEIFEAIKRAALIHQSGGGTGFAFSRLRPKDSLVKSTGGRASGPVSFLKVFNAATEAVKQGGTRRGANMGILRVDHPDILEFIESKLTGGITNFNISVTATDAFMKAVKEDKEYALVAPHTGEVTGQLRAREVFDRIVDAAWQTGDPGMIFIDRINQSPANPVPELGQVEATNPCGEQPLLPNEACNLGSINLAKFTCAGSRPAEQIHWGELERVARLGVRFLDDVIEVNPYPLPEIDESVKANRRIGIGVMGWADLLFLLEIPYASEEAMALGQRIMEFINRAGHDESQKLAQERGPFPNWPYSIYKNDKPLRNSTVTTIAPTGSISIIAGCSSGIEPIFALAFRHIVGDRQLDFFNPIFEKVAKQKGFGTPEILTKVAASGAVGGITEIPERDRQVFACSHEIPSDWHVQMQAAFQKHTDNGVSKTINLPNEATREDIDRAYRMSYDLGCTGITVFRDGCKPTQVLHRGSKATEKGPEQGKPAEAPAPPPVVIKPRPRALRGTTYRMETPIGTAFITVNENGNGEPFEVFANVGKAGSDTSAVSEAVGRLVSLMLRLPSSLTARERIRQIVDQLSGIGGGRPLGFGKDRVRSLPDAIAQVLAQYVEPKAAPAETAPHQEPSVKTLPGDKVGDLCPDCGEARVVYEEGCRKCHACGFSEC